MLWRTGVPAAVTPEGMTPAAAFVTAAQVQTLPAIRDRGMFGCKRLLKAMFSPLALCVEVPQPKSDGDDQETGLNMSSRVLKHTSAAIPVALLVVLGLALAVFALVKAHASKRLCWGQSYERLSGSASINMPHGVPEPDSGDEVDVVYTSRGGSVYRRYSFIHEQDRDADQDMDESICLSQS